MQSPSELEIERERANLRHLRRLSSAQGPGALALDPDLPQPISPASTLSPASPGYWESLAPNPANDANEPPQPDEGSLADDPAHLFWVPAHLHPELAPGEFRAFLKEHARSAPDAATPARSPSTGSQPSRRKSMLSRQYQPSATDNVENEQVVSVRRNRSRIYSHAGPQLTIGDLQKLEELADEASRSNDPTKLRNVLRRSLSLNVAPSFIDDTEDTQEADDADSPIIVPRPGQILRRTARTKIRKPELAGDGGGHRFAATRRGTAPPAVTPAIPAPNIDHGDPYPRPSAPIGDDEGYRGLERIDERPLSFSEEHSIFDSYADRRVSASSFTSDEELSTGHNQVSASPPPISISPEPELYEPKISPVEEGPQLSVPPTLHHPTPQRLLGVPQAEPQPMARTPSPQSSLPDSPQDSSEQHSIYSPSVSTAEPTSFLSTSPTTSPKRKEKEKEKKSGGLFSKTKWTGKDKGMKSVVEKAVEKEKEKEKEASREKESGFFGSLFGKKKHDETASGSSGGPASASLLTKSRPGQQSVSPVATSPTLANAYARYPIHVERAVYRLSHIKLANPRRPLYEQVLISNLMFWYLGVINKTQGPPTSPQATSPQSPTAREEKEKQERAEMEKREAEQKERERLETEKEKETAHVLTKKESGKRGSLNKSLSSGGAAGNGGQGRRAEMPVKGPQYDVQHLIMEQEGGYAAATYGTGPGNGYSQPTHRPGSAPPTSGGYQDSYDPARNPYHSQSPYSPQQDQHYMSGSNLTQYYPSYPPNVSPISTQSSSNFSLPPGAMPPVSSEQSWLNSSSTTSTYYTNQSNRQPDSYPDASSSSNSKTRPLEPRTSPSRSRSPPPRSPRRSQSPPPTPSPPPGVPAGKLQGRSLSASAVQPVPSSPNDANGRPNSAGKKPSVKARPVLQRRPKSNGTKGEAPPADEDMPLAMWQYEYQQRERNGGGVANRR